MILIVLSFHNVDLYLKDMNEENKNHINVLMCAFYAGVLEFKKHRS